VIQTEVIGVRDLSYKITTRQLNASSRTIIFMENMTKL